MNYQSRLRGVLLAALVSLTTWSTGAAWGQQPGDYGAYDSAPHPVQGSGPGNSPPLLPGSMGDTRQPTRPYGYDSPPPPMNSSYMMPAGGTPGGPPPGFGAPMPGAAPMVGGSMPTGPMLSPLPMMNGAMPNGGPPTVSEPPYSTYPMNTPAGGWASGGCTTGRCGSAGNCGPKGCGTGCETGCGTGMCGSSSSPTGVFDNFYGLIGLDGARGPEDLGINANVGGRAGVGTVVTLLEDAGLALQLGYAANYHNNATRFQRINGGPGERHQQFTTIGLFQRTCSGFLWGVAYDYVHTNSYDHIDASQWRGQVGWKVDSCNEFGVWGTHHDRGDTVGFGGESYHIRSIDMAAFYYTRYWSCAMTRVWVGAAERHGRAIAGVLPDDGPIDNQVIYGADFLVPLSPCVSLYGEANFITPLDSGVVAAFVGVVIYPGGAGNQIPRSRFAPMFSIANNATFALDARRSND